MTKRFTPLRSILAVVTLTIAFAATKSTARADEITFTGTARGCFHGCTIVAPNTTFLDLTYNGSTFNGTTVGGLLGLGTAANQSNNVNNFGSFRLNPFPIDYNNVRFTLVVTFTSPSGINSGNNPIHLPTLIEGRVSSNSVGSLVFDFDNTPQFFTFSNANGTGAFLFNINDVSVIVGGLVPITGTIRVTTPPTPPTATPEPATMVLLGTGLTGIAMRLRHRLRGRGN